MAIPNKPTYSHGSTGTEPGSPIDYQNGDPLDEAELDYYLNIEFTKIKALIDALETLDSNDDGKVDAADVADLADTADLYKNNDIDSDGDGKVDSADVADTAKLFKNNDIDSDGDGKVDSAENADDAANVTGSYKGNDIDSNGDGRIDNAEQATDAANVTGSYKGNDIDSDGDGVVNTADYANDSDASTYKGTDIDPDGDGKVNSAENADEAGNADTVDNYQADEIVSSGFTFPVMNYGTGTNFEVWRCNLQAGEQLEVRRVDVGLKGGGSDSDVSLDLYDVSNNTSLVSDTVAGNVSRGKPIATSQSGATIIARLTNNTGSNQNITVTVKANIKE
jgi:hypothetical protein